MIMLSKKTTVLVKHSVQRHDDFVYYQYEGDNDAYRVGYYMPRIDFDWMGQPETITVAAVPGDQTTNGLRDEGERTPVESTTKDEEV